MTPWMRLNQVNVYGGNSRCLHAKLWILQMSACRLNSSSSLIWSNHKCFIPKKTSVLCRTSDEDFCVFKDMSLIDPSIYIFALLCHTALGTSANSASLFWGYCSNLVSQADKGIHLAANPFSDSDRVSQAHPVRSKYVCCLIIKILPA